MTDIYFEENYGKLYQTIENGTSEVFEYESTLGKIQHMFIKREIPISFNQEVYYDLTTPYGYGGPLIIECKEGFANKLVEEFNSAFQEYCTKNNVVSEFVRFHPTIGNFVDFKPIYDVENLRKTVGTNIQKYQDPNYNEFSKSAWKTIRRAIRAGVSYKVTKSPNDISNFKQIYYSTMDRNEANDYYYFNDQYFEECLRYFKDNIILVEVSLEDTVIAAAFYFVYKDIIHAHLSGTLEGYLNYSPAYIIKYATAEWAKENHINLIHYGGGKSSDLSDSLYQFKKKFGKNTEFDFHIGKKIWNKKVYYALCNLKNIEVDTVFFPAYRKTN